MDCGTLFKPHKWTRWHLVSSLRSHLELTGKELNRVYELAAGQTRECTRCGLIGDRLFNHPFTVRDETPASVQEAGGPQSTTNTEQETIHTNE